MFSELDDQEITRALDSVTHEVLATACIEGPPVDALRVAACLGIAVALDGQQPGRARYVRLSGSWGRRRPSILLRPEPRAERLQWAVAHELGEHLAERVFQRLDLDPHAVPGDSRERIANHLAGRLLVPTNWLNMVGRQSDWDLARCKKQFATASHELVARRMLELPPPILISVFDQDRLTWRRGNICGHVPSLSAEERKCRLEANRTSCLAEDRAPWGRVRAWPIHEEEWKREIVRAELDHATSYL